MEVRKATWAAWFSRLGAQPDPKITIATGDVEPVANIDPWAKYVIQPYHVVESWSDMTSSVTNAARFSIIELQARDRWVCILDGWQNRGVDMYVGMAASEYITNDQGDLPGTPNFTVYGPPHSVVRQGTHGAGGLLTPWRHPAGTDAAPDIWVAKNIYLPPGTSFFWQATVLNTNVGPIDVRWTEWPTQADSRSIEEAAAF